MKIARMALLALVAVAVGGALAGCSSSDDNKSTATPTKAAVASPTATTAGQPKTIEVTAKEFLFDLTDRDLSIGRPVTYKLSNRGALPHTLTVYTDEEYTKRVPGADTGTVAAGKSGQFTVTFDKPVDYYFQCDIHTTQMRFELTVQ